MDKGWAYNLAERCWELLGPHGDVVRTVDDAMLAAGMLPEVNLHAQRMGWPELTPGSPWWHLILDGGQEDGRHFYAPPGTWEEPPEALACSPPPTVIINAVGLAQYRAQVGPLTVRGVAAATGTAMYRRQIQPCGHGRACPYPYSLDRGRW